MKSQEDTVAVMVVYQPPDAVLQSVEVLLPQVKALVIVDNGMNAALRAQLEPKVVWIQNPENNLAKAQNLGIAKAREMGAEFVLLMDDDSLSAADMVAQLRAAWAEGMGVVGPVLIEPSLDRKPAFIQAQGKYGFKRIHPVIPAKAGIQSDSSLDSRLRGNDVIGDLFYVAASGSLIPLSVIDKIGGMNERLGLYFVDTEFCLRVRKAGLDVVVVKDARMQHSFGKVTRHFMGITTTNHSAEARLKMFKNRKQLWLDYLQAEPGYVMFDMVRAATEMLRVLLFEKQKMAKMVAMIKGLFSV